jgi:hypothetical protein
MLLDFQDLEHIFGYPIVGYFVFFSANVRTCHSRVTIFVKDTGLDV